MNQWFFHTIFDPKGTLETTYARWTYLAAAVLIAIGIRILISGASWIKRKSAARVRMGSSKVTAALYMYPLLGVFVTLAGVALASGAATYRFAIHVDDTGIRVRDGSSEVAGQWDSLWEVHHAKVGPSDEIVSLVFFRRDPLSITSSDERLGSYFANVRDAILQRTNRIDLKSQQERLRSAFHP